MSIPGSVRRACTLLLLAASLSAGAEALATTTDPAPAENGEQFAALRVRGICHAGGRIDVRIRPVDDSYEVTTTARGLPAGSRWRTLIYEMNEEDYRARTFRTVAKNGAWTHTVSVAALPDAGFAVQTMGPGPKDRDGIPTHVCWASVDNTQGLQAVSGCRRGDDMPAVIAYAEPRPAGQRVWFVGLGVEPRSHWKLRYSVTIDGVERNRVERVRADREGWLQKKLLFSGDVTTKIRVDAESKDSRNRCQVGASQRLAAPSVDAPPNDPDPMDATRLLELMKQLSEQRPVSS